MEISVKYAAVTGKAEQMSSDVRSIGRDLVALEARVRAEAESWEGEASGIYQRKQKDWHGNVKGLLQTLEALIAQLEDSVSGYRVTDKKAAANFDA